MTADEELRVTVNTETEPPVVQVCGALTAAHAAQLEQLLRRALETVADRASVVIDLSAVAGGEPNLIAAPLTKLSQSNSSHYTCRAPAAVAEFMERMGLGAFVDIEVADAANPTSSARDALPALPDNMIEVLEGDLSGMAQGRVRVYVECEGYCADIHVAFSPSIAALAKKAGCHPCEWERFHVAVIELLQTEGKLDPDAYYRLTRAELGAQSSDTAVFEGLLTNVAKQWCGAQGMRLLKD